MSTNLYKCTKLVKKFYFCRIFFHQSYTFYTILTSKEYLFTFVCFKCFDGSHFRLNKKISLPLTAKGRFLYENSDVAKQECQSIIVICIPILQSEGLSFFFPHVIKFRFFFHIEILG